ncbi:hypothetical protein D3C80_1809920 [compost metagenome]
MHCRLGDANHRPVCQLPRRQQARIAETGDDMTADSRISAQLHLLQYADRSNGFVKMPFY